MSHAAMCCLALMLSTLAAAQPHLLSFVGAENPSVALPANAQAAQAVRVHTDRLLDMNPGDPLVLQIGQDDSTLLQLQQLTAFLNGDYSLSAKSGENEQVAYGLTLTVGARGLFGYVSAGGNLWQLIASRENDGFLGWVYQPGGLDVGGRLANDYFIPDQAALPAQRSPTNNSPPVLPLKLASSSLPERSISTATTAGITPVNFHLSQHFARDPLLAGQATDISFVLHNNSSETHTAVVMEIYFLLEDSELLVAPSQCAEQLSLSLQRILRCELGDFAEGQEKTVELTVRALGDPGSVLLSTAIIGELRDDHVVNIVEDVRTDSDKDGISDFNEVLAGTNPFDAGSVDLSVSTIDVMALYTAGASDLYPQAVETRINQMIAVANQTYRESGVAISLRPVHHQLVQYNDSDDMDTALDHLVHESHPAFQGISELRTSYGADLVMLFRPLEATADRCGLAPVGGFRSNGYFHRETELQHAFSHIAIDCPVDVAVAHEVGHNMGLTHSHREDGYGGTFNFATGFGVDGQFATVMAYPGAFHTENRVARFSDPLALCLGFPCGVGAESGDGADAVQTLNLVRQQIANYLPSVVADPPPASVAAVSGDTNAAITLFASGDGGRSFNSRFSPSDRVDLSATIRVDDRHVGEQGSLHVLVGERGSNVLYQLNKVGELQVWDGDLASLVAVGNSHVLGLEERLSLLSDFQFGSDLVGLELLVYIGYRVPGSEDFVYTDTPLSLSIVTAD